MTEGKGVHPNFQREKKENEKQGTQCSENHYEQTKSEGIIYAKRLKHNTRATRGEYSSK